MHGQDSPRFSGLLDALRNRRALPPASLKGRFRIILWHHSLEEPIIIELSTMRRSHAIAVVYALALRSYAQDDSDGGLTPVQQCWLNCGVEALKTTDCGIT